MNLSEVKHNSDSKWRNTLKGTDLYDMVDTYADLTSIKPKDGMKVQVNNDENHDGEVVVYVYKHNKWKVADESKDNLQSHDVISRYLTGKQKNINNKNGITRNAEILFLYGLSPVLIQDAVPLFDKENSTMIQVVGINRKNSALAKISKDLTTTDQNDVKVDEDKDTLIIVPYEKVMYPHDDYTYNVTFAKEKKPSYEMSVTEFKNKIYNKPYNLEAIENAEKGIDFTNEELVTNALYSHNLKLNQDKYDSTEAIVKDLNPNLFKDIDPSHENEVLNTLVKKKKQGWTDDDLDFLMKEFRPYLEWQDMNKEVFQAISNLIENNESIDEDRKKDLMKEIKSQKQAWFRKDLKGEKLHKAMGKWYKSVTESSMTEAKYVSSAPKPLRVTDPGDVAEILYKLGIDTKYLKVPFTKLGRKNMNTEEDDAEYRIKGFESKEDIDTILNLQDLLRQQQDTSTIREELQAKKQELEDIKNSTQDAELYIKTAQEYNALENELKQIETLKSNLENKMNTTVVFIKKYENGKEVGLPEKINLNELYRDLGKAANFNKSLDVPEHDLNNPNENLNQNKFYKVKLSSNIISKIVDKAKDRYKDEVPRGYTIPNGLTGKTWEQYAGTDALSIALNLANSQQYNNYRITKATDRQTGKIFYYGLVPKNPESKMNRFPPHSITKMV